MLKRSMRRRKNVYEKVHNDRVKKKEKKKPRGKRKKKARNVHMMNDRFNKSLMKFTLQVSAGILKLLFAFHEKYLLFPTTNIPFFLRRIFFFIRASSVEKYSLQPSSVRVYVSDHGPVIFFPSFNLHERVPNTYNSLHAVLNTHVFSFYSTRKK